MIGPDNTIEGVSQQCVDRQGYASMEELNNTSCGLSGSPEWFWSSFGQNLVQASKQWSGLRRVGQTGVVELYSREEGSSRCKSHSCQAFRSHRGSGDTLRYNNLTSIYRGTSTQLNLSQHVVSSSLSRNNGDLFTLAFDRDLHTIVTRPEMRLFLLDLVEQPITG